MPRRLVERVYYKKCKPFGVDQWPVRCWRKFYNSRKGLWNKPNVKIVLRKVPIYVQALAFARNRNNSEFNSRLRKDCQRFDKQTYSRRVRQICANEEASLKVREKTSQQNYSKSLAGKNDNQ